VTEYRMAMPESFKFDVRVRERLLAKGELTEAEIEKNLEALPDSAANAIPIELKQPAFQTEAERAENAVVVRAAPPRPVTIAAPINMDEEDDEEDEEPLPKKPAEKVEKVEKVAKAPEPAAAAKSDEDEDADEDSESDDEDEDDEDDEDDSDADEDDADKGESGEDS
jgi:hypothetical protein